ncbi:MAG: carbonic anhydrase [Kiloniellales bacterium]
MAALATQAYVRPARADDAPVNEKDGEQALEELMAGNARYVAGGNTVLERLADKPPLSAGQAPFATILSCSDSRVVPEIMFDQVPGALFIVRVAGNILTTDGLASIEFATKVLGSRLVMVVGHEACGAVAAAIEVVKNGLELPGHLPGLVASIKPAVDEAMGMEGSLLENAIDANVTLGMRQLAEAKPILAESVASGQVKLAGGVFNFETREVELLA